ncbi:MAG: choice-of-anchor B family protein [Rhodothermales bacterium]
MRVCLTGMVLLWFGVVGSSGVWAYPSMQGAQRLPPSQPVHKSKAQDFSRALALFEQAAFVGEPLTGDGTGAVHVFLRDALTGTWIHRQALRASDETLGNAFGQSLAVDGPRLVVGAPMADGGTGAAYIFHREADGTWVEEARLTASDGQPGDRLGEAVALNQDHAVLAAPLASDETGAAYVFRREGDGTWIEEARLTASDGQARDQLGEAVAVSGDYIALGAPFMDNRVGSVYVFRQDSTSGLWVEEQKLVGQPVGVPTDNFGVALDMVGIELLVGASSHNATGAVYVFRRDASTNRWIQTQRMTGGTNDNFGFDLDATNEALIVSAIGAHDFLGAAVVFRRDGNGHRWIEEATLNADRARREDGFGRPVAIQGGQALVGAPGDAFVSGAAYLFERRTGTEIWDERTRLTSPTGDLNAIVGSKRSCDEGIVEVFQCRNVSLLSFLPIRDIGGPGTLNDVWGWTDPLTGKEYALVGRNDGTAFVDVSDPVNPVYLGLLPTQSSSSSTRDVKVYRDHVFIVADLVGDHGMQVFDLKQLRGLTGTPVRFEPTTLYSGIGSAHNLAINEDTGYAYIVGGSEGGTTCGGGLHMVDVRDPLTPAFVGCFTDIRTGRGYTHDAQCVVYRGPDSSYGGREICIGSNAQAIGLVDVTDKAHPIPISTAQYPRVGYVHQGWLTEDHRYFFQNDEGDEFAFGMPTRTLIWDFSDLDNPVLLTEYFADTQSTDHNLYIRGDLLFETNYTSGLRILDITDVAHPIELAFLDTTPGDVGFGTWSNYPFFESGTIAVSSITEGLFLVEMAEQPVALEAAPEPAGFILAPAFPNPFTQTSHLTLTVPVGQPMTVAAYDMLGRRVAVLHEGFLVAGTHRLDFEAGRLTDGFYIIKVRGTTGSRTRSVLLLR